MQMRKKGGGVKEEEAKRWREGQGGEGRGEILAAGQRKGGRTKRREEGGETEVKEQGEGIGGGGGGA